MSIIYFIIYALQISICIKSVWIQCKNTLRHAQTNHQSTGDTAISNFTLLSFLHFEKHSKKKDFKVALHCIMQLLTTSTSHICAACFVTPYDVDMMIQDSVIGWHCAANMFASFSVFLLCSMDKIKFV